MRNVAVLLPSTVRSFELAVYTEVFGGFPAIDYTVASEHPGVPVPIPGGLAVTPTAGLDRLAVADVIVRADASVLYLDDDPFFTSAGSGAALDLCLHLLAKDYGAAAAATITRDMLVAPHRIPGQAQPAAGLAPVPRRDDGIDDLLDWALGNLHEELSIEVLARRALLSRRSFARRFRAATGTTPYAWVLEQRVRLAQELLERDPGVGVEETAGRAGFSSAALLRQHFQRRFGCSPTEYRARFAPLSR